MAIYVGRREQFIGNSESESESCYDWRSVGQSVLV
jgi:hypothetical protein